MTTLVGNQAGSRFPTRRSFVDVAVLNVRTKNVQLIYSTLLESEGFFSNEGVLMVLSMFKRSSLNMNKKLSEASLSL